MTEDEWLACCDPGEMLEFLRDKASERKLRFASGQFCHNFVAAHAAEIMWGEIELSTLAAADEASEFGHRPRELVFSVPESKTTLPFTLYQTDAYTAARGTWNALESLLLNALFNRYYLRSDFLIDRDLEVMEAERLALMAAFSNTQCVLLREIFGNPFQPVAFDPAWRTDTAVSLARQMYESREFSAMPILADALQDAGCENSDILNHCRDANATHVRGCWVVDLLLGK